MTPVEIGSFDDRVAIEGPVRERLEAAGMDPDAPVQQTVSGDGSVEFRQDPEDRRLL